MNPYWRKCTTFPSGGISISYIGRFMGVIGIHKPVGYEAGALVPFQRTDQF